MFHSCPSALPSFPPSLIPLDLSSSAKMGTLTSGTCTMRRLCTSSAWGPRSWPQRELCSPESHGRMRTNSGGQSVFSSSWCGPERSWTRGSTSAPTSTPPTTRKTPACTMLLPRAWRHVSKWASWECFRLFFCPYQRSLGKFLKTLTLQAQIENAANKDKKHVGWKEDKKGQINVTANNNYLISAHLYFGSLYHSGWRLVLFYILLQPWVQAVICIKHVSCVRFDQTSPLRTLQITWTED